MSDELKALQETATQARAKADELKAALTDDSSDEERTAADDAEKAATEAEGAFADAKAKADAEAAAQGGDAQPKAGDACTCPDGRVGTLHANDTGDGFVCIPNQG
jgi:hypothetical protein